MLTNARRGLAKPSSHGEYLAMDLEPIHRDRPITAKVGLFRSNGEIGALGLLFGREQAESMASREEYSPSRFLQLLEICDRAGKPLGEFLLGIAQRVRFDLLAYRTELFEMLGYSSPGYMFHPLPLDDGRVAIVAIGSGFEGSGDPALRSRRQESGMDKLLRLPEALALRTLPIDYQGQLGYFLECILGGLHGMWIGDLLAGLEIEHQAIRDFVCELAKAFTLERDHFMSATSLTSARYRERFGGVSRSGMQPFLALAGLG